MPAVSVLYYQLGESAVHVATTSGAVTLTCDRPRMLLRDLLAGRAQSIVPDERCGEWPFGCTVAEAIHYNRAPRGGNNLTVPDNAPLAPGCILIEAHQFAAYHPVQSLQLVGMAGGDIFLSFASIGYHAKVDPMTGESIFEALRVRLADGKGFHLTSFDPAGCLNWLPCKREYVKELKETANLPDQLGGWQRVLDLRYEPMHADFRGRAVMAKKNFQEPDHFL